MACMTGGALQKEQIRARSQAIAPGRQTVPPKGGGRRQLSFFFRRPDSRHTRAHNTFPFPSLYPPSLSLFFFLFLLVVTFHFRKSFRGREMGMAWVGL